MDKRARSSKVSKLAAGTLLIHRSRASKTIREAVDEASVIAAAHLQQRSAITKASALGAILMASKGLASKLTVALVASRQAARAAATHRLMQELRVAGVEALPGHLGHPSSRHDEDYTSAEMAAGSLAASWRALAAASVLQALRKDAEPSRAIQTTSRAMKANADRTALTEVTIAYNDEHRAAMVDGMRHNGEFARALADAYVMRRWDCELERTCDSCLSHEGELTTADGDFSGGDEPGHMHPRCACMSTLVQASPAEYAQAA